MKIKVFLFFSLLLTLSCNKPSEDIGPVSDEISIVGLTATRVNIKAWDTTSISVVAVGDQLNYSWEANHGTVLGQGTTVKYSAGNCCMGLNTITCRAYNETGFVEDTIMIRIRNYYENP